MDICLRWSDIEEAIEIVKNDILAKGNCYDAIMGIPRGGLVPAVILSNKLRIKMVSNYIGEDKKRCLLVDDIWDSGCTFNTDDNIRYTRVALFVRWPEFGTPEHWGKSLEHNEWVVFPWEL